MRFDNALTATGNVAPAATIVGASTTLSSPSFITLDAVADRLYVADTGNTSILIYDNISTKTGNVAPTRIIAGTLHTTLSTPVDVALDRVRNLLYVADEQEILVFASASTTTGDVAPARTLSFAFGVAAVFVDTVNDRLFAADSIGNTINVYDNASTLPTGTPAASRSIQGTSTHMSNPGAIQVDGAGRLVVSNSSASSITIYSNAAGANGNLAPVAEITGSNTGLSIPDQIVVDTSGTGSLYNADPSAARIAVFANLSTATGNIGPTRSITGTNTGLTAGGPVGVALDNTR